MKNPLKILFDFDGTLCSVETIPYVASRAGIDSSGEIEAITTSSCSDYSGYELNLRRRIAMMRDISIADFRNYLSEDLLRPEIARFVREHRDICVIASCNLNCWCSPLADSLDIPAHFSTAQIENGRAADILEFLDKGRIVEQYRREGYRVVFVGDSANDIQALEASDIPIFFNTGNLDATRLPENFIIANSEKELAGILDNLLNDL